MIVVRRGTGRSRRGANTSDHIRAVALNLFYERGFQATTLREIASIVGIKVGSLYNHIASKRDLLFEIMEAVMLDLLAIQDGEQTADIVERIRLLTYRHVKFHCERAAEVFVGNSELRSLNRAQHSRMVALRHQYVGFFQNALRDGIQQGDFVPLDVPVIAYGIIAMATSVAAWYSPGGRLSLEEIAEIHTAIVLRGIWNRSAGELESRLQQVNRACCP